MPLAPELDTFTTYLQNAPHSTATPTERLKALSNTIQLLKQYEPTAHAMLQDDLRTAIAQQHQTGVQPQHCTDILDQRNFSKPLRSTCAALPHETCTPLALSTAKPKPPAPAKAKLLHSHTRLKQSTYKSTSHSLPSHAAAATHLHSLPQLPCIPLPHQTCTRL